MTRDHTSECQNTVANIAMSYSSLRNATNMIHKEVMGKCYTPSAVNMGKSEYPHSKNPHNFLIDCLITKEMDIQDIFDKRYVNIIVCLLLHQCEAI